MSWSRRLVIDLIRKSNAELEDMLLELCGRLELSDEEVELLQLVEEERERRSEAEDERGK
ncbi:MAG: hypothetical protein Q7J06_09815 [Bacteroidales bacterium]|nr:hypothetical protein [Bacteroidales bacterium]